MRLFNSINFENVLHMKLYRLLVLNKIQKYRYNNFKALKTTELVLFPRRTVYCHVNKMPPMHNQSNHLATSLAAALNWSGNVMTGGGGLSYSIDGLLNAGPTASTCGQMLC